MTETIDPIDAFFCLVDGIVYPLDGEIVAQQLKLVTRQDVTVEEAAEVLRKIFPSDASREKDEG